MLECIKFGDDKVKTIQIGNKWFVAVRDILIVSGASPDTLKGIVHNNLPHQYKCSIKEIGISGSYYGSKYFTLIPRTCRLILVLIHCDKYGDRYGVLDFLVERHKHLQDQAREAQKTEHVVLDDSIAIAKNYREHI